MSGIDHESSELAGLASYSAVKSPLMPKILQMFKRRKRRKGTLRRALGLHDKAAANIITFPPVFPEIQEEYPDYEIISRWLRLADEMLGSGDRPQWDDYDVEDRRRKA
jgi:hypothetical protein